MKKKLRLKTFRKNIIQLLIFLGIVTFLSSSQKYIPYTRNYSAGYSSIFIVFGFEYCN